MDPPSLTDLDAVERVCLARPGATADHPFGPDTRVFRVGGRMFALVATRARPLELSLKCEPDLAVALRARYAAVGPGYHLNKRHWNTVVLDGSVPDEHVRELIELSYELVVAKLDRATRRALGD